ncbi:adenylate/guanylate cyclase [Desulfocucumis palustris]|uniref:Adenylate/guanylate cyclase n=1 Tax=Desulfocucumis palustris TaxID=1898651 RepID=A0A2L2XHA5_9FIRM|nr:diguanylate cyclase [Desulfocucumis palustris]GBF33606.1 adenylate/guanylate cyclase [Desulfocucumis palustris]
MSNVTFSQTDYILLLHSLSFIILAAACCAVKEPDGKPSQWFYLALFGVFHGVHQWPAMIKHLLGETLSFSVTSSSLLLISFLFLMEFGRRGTAAMPGGGPGKWVYIPAAALALLGTTGAVPPLTAPAVFILGAVGGVWAARALFLRAKALEKANRRRLATAAVAMVLIAATSLVVTPGYNFASGNIFSGQAFSYPAAILLQMILALAAAIALWGYSLTRPASLTGTRYDRMRKNNFAMMVVSLVLALSAGWLFTQYLGNQALKDLIQSNQDQVNLLSNQLLLEFDETERAANIMAGSPWIAPALITRGKEDIDRANSILDRYKKAIGTSECYLLDMNGKTIASSNRNSPTSFVGKYYNFRPYYRQAAAGTPGRYFALGVTTGARGFYASSPVRNDKKQIIGVVVIKKTIGSIEECFQKYSQCFFISPQGLVFLSSDKDLMLKSLWPLTLKEQQDLKLSRQFGDGPFSPLLNREPHNNEMIYFNDQKFLVSRFAIYREGWSIVLLSPTHLINAYRLFSIAIILVFCTLIIVFFLALRYARESEARIAASERHYHSLVEGSPNCVTLFDREGRFLSINRAGLTAMGWTGKEARGKMFSEIWPITSRPLAVEAIRRVLEGTSYTFEAPYIRNDNRKIVWSVALTPVYGEDGEICNIVGISTDITERKLAGEKLLAAHQQLLDIIEFLPDATFVIDREKKVIAWNRALEELTGVSKADIVGKGDYAYSVPFWGHKRPILIDLINPGDKDREKLYDFVERNGSTLYSEVFVPYVYKGKGAYLSVTASPLFDRYGNTVGAIESIRDITQRKQMEKQLKYLVLHDPLTGLYNRAHFEQEMNRLESGRYQKAGIIICDVDGLKLINDTLGHDAGDDLLISAAGVIRDSFRKEDMVARIGGDEFAVLLPDAGGKSVEDFCNRIREAISIHNQTKPELPLSISIGFAFAENTFSMAELFKEADNNMYKEKLHHGKSARSTIIQTLLKAQEEKNKASREHAGRLQELAGDLGRATGLPEQSIEDLCLLAQLHDIGNVGIADNILLKPGPLTADETKEMQRHCEIGHRIALSAPELSPVADWILKHHEWWNGQGYPYGLKETEIPLQCRILAIADAYDAMTSPRPYRRAVTHNEAVDEIISRSGTQFDPELVKVFARLMETQNEKYA